MGVVNIETKNEYRCTKCNHLLGKGEIKDGYIEILCSHSGKNTGGKKCSTINKIPIKK